MTDHGESKVSISKREIKINGYISLSTVSAVARAIRDMQRHTLEPIFVIIGNSHGGCASSGQMIFGMLRSAVAPIFTVVEQFAWSSAFYIFLAGKRRIMFRGARTGPHSVAITRYKDVSYDLVQQHSDMMYTKAFDKQIVKTIRSVVKMPPSKIWEMCLTKKIFSAHDALKIGIATDLALAKTFYKPRPRNKRRKTK